MTAKKKIVADHNDQKITGSGKYNIDLAENEAEYGDDFVN